MSSARQLGISEKEYEEALLIEKLFFLASQERCGYCRHGKVTHVDIHNYELYCSSCSYKGRNIKKIGEDLIHHYDVQKLEAKFGMKNYKYEKHSSYHNSRMSRQRSKSRNKRSSSSRKYESSSESLEYDSEYERARREREKERKRRKREKEKEKEKKKLREKERVVREKEKHREKSRRKKETESISDNDDVISMVSYDVSTPGMMGLKKVSNKSSKKNVDSFANANYKKKKNKSSSNFGDFETKHLNSNNYPMNSNMQNSMSSNSGQFMFDSYQKENVDYHNYIDVPATGSMNIGHCSNDFNSNIYWNKGNADSNFNMTSQYQQQPLPLHQQKQNGFFFNGKQHSSDDFNYFNNSNIPNMPDNNNTDVMNRDTHLCNNKNPMPNQYCMNNGSSYYNYDSTKNTHLFNNMTNINNETDDIYSKHMIYNNFPSCPYPHNTCLNRSVASPKSTNNFNCFNYGKKNTCLEQLKKEKPCENSNNNNSDFTAVAISDKNPFSIQNLISSKYINRKNYDYKKFQYNTHLNSFGCNRNVFEPMNHTLYETNKRF